jgi:hypothetical protein
MATLLYMTPAKTKSKPTIASMRGRARDLLTARGIDPDGLADQGDVAADLGLGDRRSVSYLRQQYRGADGVRGRDLEPFPAPTKWIGSGRGAPVWHPRWRVLAWHLTRPQTHTDAPTDQE